MAIDASSHLLLAGGTGFFGRALLRLWKQHQVESISVPCVTLLTRSPAEFEAVYPEFCSLPWLTLLEADVCDAKSFPPIRTFTHVLHAATSYTQGGRLPPLQRYDQIVTSTRNLLALAVDCEAQAFLLTSSGAVYGRQPDHLDRIPEDYHGMPDPLNAANAYGMGKRTAEHLCALYHQRYGIRTVIARGFSFIGRDMPMDESFAVGNFIRDALWNDDIVVGGDGTQQRSYLDQQDLAHWLLALLDRGQANRAYNVGSDQAISIAALAHQVRDLLSPGKPIRFLGSAEGKNNRNYYIPDIERVRRELGLEVTTALDQAIIRAAEAARKNSGKSGSVGIQ